MTTHFHYHPVPGAIDGKKRPHIPIFLKWGTLAIQTAAILDSGADTIVLPRSVAEGLGLDLTGEKSPSVGIGGSAECINSRVQVKVAKGQNERFFEVPILVIDNDKEFPILLGRQGFFSRYVITIDETEKRITLKPKNTGIRY